MYVEHMEFLIVKFFQYFVMNMPFSFFCDFVFKVDAAISDQHSGTRVSYS